MDKMKSSVGVLWGWGEECAAACCGMETTDSARSNRPPAAPDPVRGMSRGSAQQIFKELGCIRTEGIFSKEKDIVLHFKALEVSTPIPTEY